MTIESFKLMNRITLMIDLPEGGGSRIEGSGVRGEDGGERPNASREGIKQFCPSPWPPFLFQRDPSLPLSYSLIIRTDVNLFQFRVKRV